MLIDTRKIKQKCLSSQDFFFEYESEEFQNSFGYRINGPIQINGTVTLQADEVYVDMSICCNIVGECARCLEKVEKQIVFDEEVKFVHDNPEEDDYLMKNDNLDLHQAVEDAIFNNFPMVLYCKEDCKGLCPKCGINLNNSTCNCAKENN